MRARHFTTAISLAVVLILLCPPSLTVGSTGVIGSLRPDERPIPQVNYVAPSVALPPQTASSAGGIAYTLVPMNGSVMPGLFQPEPGFNGISNGIVYDPIDGRIFLGPDGVGGLAVINASSGQPVSALPFRVPSISMVFDPRLDEVFGVGDSGGLGAFNASTLAPVYRNITIGRGPSTIVYDSRDDLLFIAAELSSDIWVVNPNNGTVVGSPIPVYSNPDDLVYDPTGDRVYVAVHDNNDPTQLGRVLALNGSTRSWDPSVNWSVGGGFFSMAIVPSRNWLYVGNYGSSNVSVFNASTGRAVSAGIKVGLGPEDTLYYPPTDSVIVSTEGGTYEINVSTNNVTNSTTPGAGAGYLSYDTKDKTIYINLGSYVGVFDPRVSLSLRYIQLQYSLGDSTFDAANGNIYVINPTGVNDTSYGSVLAINGTSHRFQHTSFPVGRGADAIQFDGADGKLYVANQYSNSVSAINPANGTTNVFNLPNGFGPDAIAIDTHRNMVYITADGTSNATDASVSNMTVVNGTTDKIVSSSIPVGIMPSAALYDPLSDRVYVTNCGSNNVSVFNANTRVSAGPGIPVGWCPTAVALDPKNGEIWVANTFSNNVTVINGSTGAIIGSVGVGAYYPDSIVYDSANGLMYVANAGSDSVSAINPNTLTTVGPGIDVSPPELPSYAIPGGLSYDPNRAEVYVQTYYASAAFVIGDVPGPIHLSVSRSTTEVGLPIQFLTNVSGGSTPYAYSYSGLPSGCGSINVSLLFCIPESGGNFSVTVTVTDSRNYTIRSQLDLIVLSKLVVGGISISNNLVDVGVPITLRVLSSGGVNFPTFAYQGLPPGCISANVSPLQCTPTIPGTYTIQAIVTDSAGASSEAVSPLVVAPLPKITLFVADPASVPVDSSILFFVESYGGVAPFNYSYHGLPPGCVSENNSTIQCVPNAPGEFGVTVSMSDSFGLSAAASVRMSVAPLAAAPLPRVLAFFASPPVILLGNGATFYVVTNGGVAPLSLNYTGLPAGCQSTSTSKLGCVPVAAGLYQVTVTVMDSQGRRNTSSTNLSVNVNAGKPPPIKNSTGLTIAPSWIEVLAAAAILGGIGGLASSLVWTRIRGGRGGLPSHHLEPAVRGNSEPPRAGGTPAKVNKGDPTERQ